MTNEWLKNIARLNLPVYQFKSEKVKILYAGYSSIKRNYFIRLLLNGPNITTFIGRRWFWTIPDLIKNYDPYIVISEISPILMNRFKKYNGFIIPEWATMRIDIDRPMSEICSPKLSDFSDVKRLVRKYNLTYEISDGIEHIKFFYDRMYVPFAKKRHGNEAWIIDLDLILKSTPPPSLLVIRENGEIAGASIVKKTGDSFALLYLGILDGNEEYRRHGIIGAIYYFGILEGKKMDCKYLDVGGSRPFLTDNITKFKKGLGAEFVPKLTPKRNYLWFGVNENSTAACEYIKSNPFMYISDNNVLVKFREYEAD
jgi:hypothetical protein